MSVSSLLLKAKNDPSSTKLFGSDLQNYIKKIEMEQSDSLQNKGLLLENSGDFDGAIVKYNSSAESLK